MGYLSANTSVTQKALEAMDSKVEMPENDDNTNQLLIQIISCNHVQSRRGGKFWISFQILGVILLPTCPTVMLCMDMLAMNKMGNLGMVC